MPESAESELMSDFIGLPPEERHKVLSTLDPDYRSLPPVEQKKVMQYIQSGSADLSVLFEKGGIPKDTPEYTMAQKIYMKTKSYAQTPVEVGAMIGGGVFGSGLGPVGTVVGAGLGAGGARSFFNFLDASLGLKESQGIAKESVELGKVVLSGAEAEMGGQVAGKVIGKGYSMLPEKVRHPIKALKRSIALTKEGAKAKALEKFQETSRGSELTQPQIDINVQTAKSLESKIPGLQFTQGQLTNDASAISLERTLARAGGQDLSQTQREFANKALRDYYSSKVAGAGRVGDFTAVPEQLNRSLQAATKEAEDAVNAEVMRLSRGMDEQTVGTTIFERLSKAKGVLKAKATALYNRIPNVKLPSEGLNQGLDDLVRAENGIIEPRTAQMIKLVKSQIQSGGEAADIGYQNLRQIRSRIGFNLRAARAGAAPNLEDVRQLKLLNDKIEAAMEQVTQVNPEIKALYKEASSFYRETYVPKVRQGTVADVLQPGVRGEASRIASANIAKEFDSLNGIDDFLNVVGDDAAAKLAMRDYYAFDLLNSAKDPVTGQLVYRKAAQWLTKNTAKLAKLGIQGEFKNLTAMQKTVEEHLKYVDVFNKSVAGRILESDTDTVIASAFRGSKNYAQTANELLAMVKDNKAAEAGLKKAVADHLVKQSETTAIDFFQKGGESVADIEFTRSVSKLTNQIRKFMPALRVIYKNEPEKLKALHNVYQAYQTLARTAKSPVGGGSDTFELFGKTLDIVAGSTAPGKWYAFKTVRDMVNRYGQQNVEHYLRKAMFDPDYAIALEAMTKGVTPEKTSQINRLMTALIYANQQKQSTGEVDGA